MALNLYVLGNTGVGKSFLCNCLLGRWEFESKNQADSCTREVSSAEAWIPSPSGSRLPFNVFNIPGLLEADPERVQQNVRLLQSALDRKEPSIIIYVLTTEGGRVRDGDYAAFKALTEAYDIKRTSFVFLVNKLSEFDDHHQIKDYIHKVMGIFDVGFVPHYPMRDAGLKEHVAELSREIGPCIIELIRPYCGLRQTLTKIKELKLEADHIKDLKEESRKAKIAFERDMNNIREELNGVQKDNVQKTSELANTKQALYYAQQQAQSNRGNSRGGGAFRLGPLSIEW